MDGFEAFLNGVNPTQIGAGGLVAAFILCIMWGKLLPKGTVDKIEAAYKERETVRDGRELILQAQADNWHEAHDKLLEQNKELTAQVGALSESARTTAAFMQAFGRIQVKPTDESGG